MDSIWLYFSSHIKSIFCVYNPIILGVRNTDFHLSGSIMDNGCLNKTTVGINFNNNAKLLDSSAVTKVNYLQQSLNAFKSALVESDSTL